MLKLPCRDSFTVSVGNLVVALNSITFRAISINSSFPVFSLYFTVITCAILFQSLNQQHNAEILRIKRAHDEVVTKLKEQHEETVSKIPSYANV